MGNAEKVLSVDFQGGSVHDRSRYHNNGMLTGGGFIAGYDGAAALFINNEYGMRAAHSLRFDDLHGIDLTKDSFSVLFWLKLIYGGNTEWSASRFQAERGIGVDMSRAKRGGVIFSNRDISAASSGAAVLCLPQHAYLSAGIVDTGGKFHDVDGIWQPQDGRWHQIAVLFDRTAMCELFVDDEKQAEFDISQAAGQKIGCNSLAFGADVRGGFGIGAACFAKIEVFRGLIGKDQILCDCETGRLRGLIYEASERMNALGREYTEEMKKPLRKAIAAARKSGSARNAYAGLKTAYEAFLAAPQGEALLTAALLGDPHLMTPGDSCSRAVETFFADTLQSGVRAAALINVGDIGNNSSYQTGKNAFAMLSSLMDRYDLPWQMVACQGNHDTMYNSEEENYMEGTRAYCEGMQAFLSVGGKYRREGTHIDEIYREVSWKYLGTDACRAGCSYGMTIKGHHFLVLNTDYFEQTGSAKLAPGPAGNSLDPIRHGVRLYKGTLDWLEHMLDIYSRDLRPVFVLCHFPFIDTVPLSYYRETIIEDNSIGRQDPEIRALFSRYPVFYICGHLHSALGLAKPAVVYSDITGKAFKEISISSMHATSRGYLNVPSGWHLFLYEDEIILRARDFSTHEWLTAYDEIIPLNS